MAGPYSRAVNQIVNEITQNADNPSATRGLRTALENVLSQVPKGQDASGSETVQVQTVTLGQTSSVPVTNVDTSSGGYNIAGGSQSNVLNLTGTGSVTGTSTSAIDQVVVINKGVTANFGLTGAGGATVVAGSGDATIYASKTGATEVVGGTGKIAFTSTGSNSVTADLSATGNATVSAGSGNDAITIGRGSYNIDLGSGANLIQTTSASGTGGTGSSVNTNAHDGYTVSVNGSNQIVLDDGQGHTSSLSNVNVVQFSNGSTFVKASTVDEAVIARMYEAVLNRTADSGGLYSWWDAYNSGQLSLQQVGNSFLNSAEAQARGLGPSVDNTTFVTKLYENLLDRSPDTGGLQSWVNALNSGQISRADVLVGFTSSAEGTATNAGSVLLSTVPSAGLDTTPHTYNVVPDGSQTVSGGAGFDVVNFSGNKADFTTSIDIDKVTLFNASTASSTTINHSEYIKFGDGSVLISAANTDQAVIARMYDAVLHRDADAGGLQAWWSANQSGMSLQDIAHAFLTSPEFQASSGNLPNGAFVDQLYQNMFGRAADQAGHNYWTDQLAHGMSREDLVVNIAKSLEAATDTNASIKIVDHTHTY